MYISDEDIEIIDTLYKEILSLLKQELLKEREIDLKNALEYISSFYSELLIPKSNNNLSPSLYNLTSDGVLSLCGYQVCRNTNTFLYDFLKELNLKPKIQYIYIDENNDWHRVRASYANHLVVCITSDNQELVLDLYNRLYFNSNLEIIDIDNKININKEIYKESIEESKIINKYKTLQGYGTKYVYSCKY